MSPIDQSREIVESLTDNEYIRKHLHTCICEKLTVEQIKELYYKLKLNLWKQNTISTQTE